MTKYRSSALVGIVLLGLVMGAASCSGSGSGPGTAEEGNLRTSALPLQSNLGCCASQGVAAASWSTSRIDEFVNTSSNWIWHRACAQAPCSADTWDGWESGPGAPPGGAVGRPTVVSMSSGRLDLFVRGLADNKIWQRTWTSSGWSAWQDLGGSLSSSPTASSWDSQSLDVWAIGSDGRVWQRACRNLNSNCTGDTAFGGWGPLSAPTVGVHGTFRDPAAVSWGPNRVDLFVVGADNNVYWRTWNGTSWLSWTSTLGSPSKGIGSSPAVASWAAGRLDVYLQGGDGKVWRRVRQEDSVVRDWESMNYDVTFAPAVATTGTEAMHIFGIDASSNLWENYCNGMYNCRASTAGTVNAPAVASSPNLTRSDGEVTMVVVPGSQAGCGGTARALFASGVEKVSTGPSPIVNAPVSCLGQATCAHESTVARKTRTGATLPMAETATAFSNDNQLVRGSDGHPMWIKQTFDTSGPRLHVSEFVWKSTDCGQTFAYLGKVDSVATSCGGSNNYGQFQQGTVPGGFDRVEAYTDPWGAGHFLTATGVSDTCGLHGLLFWSSDGASWTLRQTLDRTEIPEMMTSTSAGNLYTLTCSADGNAWVKQFKNQGKTLSRTLTINAGCAWPNTPAVGRDVGSFALTRVGSYFSNAYGAIDVIRATIPRLNDSGQFVVDLYTLTFSENLSFGSFFPPTTISPSPNFSMRHIVMVEPDLKSGPTSPPQGNSTNVAMMFWREVGLTSGAGSESIKYVTIRDMDSVSAPATLSVTSTGAPDSWDWTGENWWDYAKGGSFWNGTNWQFFGQWPRLVSGNMQVSVNWVTLDN